MAHLMLSDLVRGSVPDDQRPLRRHRVRKPWQTVLIIGIVAFTFLLIALASVVPFSSDTAREKVVEVLAARLDSEVELGSLNLRVLPRLRAEGAGLTIRHKGRRDVPPLISVRSFSVDGNVLGLLRKHISTVTVEGLDIQIPSSDRDDAGDYVPQDLKPAYVIDNLVTTDGRLVIIPRKPGKKPKVWAIHDLHMRSVSFDRAMPFEATLTNAIPPGEIATRGTFGPWRPEEPGLTALEGRFTFDKADLSAFKGISGILSAQGTFAGRLDRIEVDGDTNTPQFTLTSVGHAIPLRAKYHTIVDGTNGDTILERIDASWLKTSMVAKGDVTDMPGAPGRRVALDVTMDPALLEDVLWLAVKTPKPPMTGALKLKTRLEIPPGDRDIVEKLLLDGTFSIAGTRFTDPDVQTKIEELSRRGSGQPEAVATKGAQTAADATSDFTGSFKLENGVLTIPAVAFDVPGAVVRLSGTYGLASETIDFKGTLFLDAKVSETVTGFKSVLLKVVDPLFKGENGGSAIPIKISGQRSNPSFGLDRGRIFKRGS